MQREKVSLIAREDALLPLYSLVASRLASWGRIASLSCGFSILCHQDANRWTEHFLFCTLYFALVVNWTTNLSTYLSLFCSVKVAHLHLVSLPDADGWWQMRNWEWIQAKLDRKNATIARILYDWRLRKWEKYTKMIIKTWFFLKEVKVKFTSDIMWQKNWIKNYLTFFKEIPVGVEKVFIVMVMNTLKKILNSANWVIGRSIKSEWVNEKETVGKS